MAHGAAAPLRHEVLGYGYTDGAEAGNVEVGKRAASAYTHTVELRGREVGDKSLGVVYRRVDSALYRRVGAIDIIIVFLTIGKLVDLGQLLGDICLTPLAQWLVPDAIRKYVVAEVLETVVHVPLGSPHTESTVDIGFQVFGCDGGRIGDTHLIHLH